MSFDSVFHGPPTSNNGQAVSGGIASLGIDVTSGQIYYRAPNDPTKSGWQQAVAAASGNAGPFVQLNPTAGANQTITGPLTVITPTAFTGLTIQGAVPYIIMDGPAGDNSRAGAIAFQNDGVNQFTLYKVLGGNFFNFDTATVTAFQIGQDGTTSFSGPFLTANVLKLTAAAAVVGSGIALGGTTAATATAGGGQAALATVLGYLIANVAGTTVKIPYFSA